jgi:hypothetical protein
MRNYNDPGIIDQRTAILPLTSLSSLATLAPTCHPLPLARISYNSCGETWQLRVRRAARLILLRAAGHVKLHIERPRQLFILLLLLTTRARSLLFPTLPLARRALVFSLILASASPSLGAAYPCRREGGGGMRRHRLRVCIGAGGSRARSAWWQREGSLVASKQMGIW